MDLVKHVRYFIVVTEERHFGRAAYRLGMAQPSLSQRIQRLERELGVRLFDRGGRQVDLTEGGRLLLAEARPLIERADALLGVAARVRAGSAGVLRAAVPPELGGAVVAALVEGFRDGSPGVRLALRELGPAVQLTELRAGTLDVGVLRHPVDVAGLGLGEVLCRPYGVLLPRPPGGERSDAAPDGRRQARSDAGPVRPDAVRPDPVRSDEDPPSGGGPVRLASLSGLDLVLFPRPSAPALHEEILSVCRRHGFEPGSVLAGQDPEFVDGLVMSGTAVTFATRDRKRPPGTAWYPLEGEPLLEQVSAAWARGRQDDPAVRFFTEVTERVLAGPGGMTPVMETAAARRTAVPRPAYGYTV
ncbi:LysR substrate-binding domain-containing protein [Streptomyces sp. NPDC006798]|uniref:LysR family transcriptional regulator n=1 Tax=Streptomyces sp. NPDC006798 TaxID=3155462 RepID=UPI0033D70CE0